ncbi:hypothetical protein BH24ACT5_BH24ACT5_04120 [soil metagenome]
MSASCPTGPARGWPLRLGLGISVAVVVAVTGLGGHGSSAGSGWPREAPVTTAMDEPAFVEVPGMPVNMLAEETLDSPNGLVLVTTHEIYDVGADEVEPITGVADPGGDAVTSVFEVAGQVIASVDCSRCDEPVGPKVFVVQNGSAGLMIAGGWGTPGLDGVWVTRRSGPRCTVAEAALDGSTLRPAREIDCELYVRDETSLGVVATRGDGYVLLDPDTFDETELPGRVVAVFDDRVMVEHRGVVSVVDPATGASTPVQLPESPGQLGYALVSPDGRHVLVVFGNPAWPGPRQLFDLWVLDTATVEWSPLPVMPVAGALKSLGMDWAPDGRFVVLGSFDDVGTALVTWTPHEERLQVRPVCLRPSSSIVAMSTGITG